MEDPWYRDGLRFACTRCGRCCRGAGNVWISDEEIGALARRLELSDDDFRSRYTRRFGRGGVVLRQQRNQDCVFWHEARGCTVYDLRPRQCRSYPFWQANLFSPESWEAEAACCPGIGEGEPVPAAEIARRAADDGIPPQRTRLRRYREEDA